MAGRPNQLACSRWVSTMVVMSTVIAALVAAGPADSTASAAGLAETWTYRSLASTAMRRHPSPLPDLPIAVAGMLLCTPGDEAHPRFAGRRCDVPPDDRRRRLGHR